MALNNSNHGLALDLEEDAGDELLAAVLASENQALKDLTFGDVADMSMKDNNMQMDFCDTEESDVNGVEDIGPEIDTALESLKGDRSTEDLDKRVVSDNVVNETFISTSDSGHCLSENESDFEELDLTQTLNLSPSNRRENTDEPIDENDVDNVDNVNMSVDRNGDEKVHDNEVTTSRVNEPPADRTEQNDQISNNVQGETSDILLNGDKEKSIHNNEVSNEDNGDAEMMKDQEEDEGEEESGESCEETEDIQSAETQTGLETIGLEGLEKNATVLLHTTAKRRKRRRKSNRWTKTSPRRPSIGTFPRKIVGKSMETQVNMDGSKNGTDGEEDGKTNDNLISEEGDRKPGTEDDPSNIRKRISRAPASRNDFVINDEALLNEMWMQTDPSAGYKRKRSRQKETSLTEEDFGKFSLPFEQGWRREIVIRAQLQMTDSGRKKQASDVYYFPPKGSKLRSMVQIADWLKKYSSDLTTSNFTFSKTPIGVAEGEVTRNAGLVGGRQSADTPRRKRMKMDTDGCHDDNNKLYDKPDIVIERDSDEFLLPLIAASIKSPEKVSISPIKRGRPPKNPVPKIEVSYPSKAPCYISPTTKTLKSTARKSTTPSRKTFKTPIPYTGIENLCSLACPGLEGIAPLLHCHICMCLFHDKCVNYFGDKETFACLRCSSMNGVGGNVTTPGGTSNAGSMHLDPKLVKSLNQMSARNKQPIVVKGSHSSPAATVVIPVSNYSSVPLYKSPLLANISGHRTNSPVLKQVLESAVKPPGSDNISMASSSTQSTVEDKQLLSDIKAEPVDNSYDVALNAGSESEKKATQLVTNLPGLKPINNNFPPGLSLMRPDLTNLNRNLAYVNQYTSQSIKKKLKANSNSIAQQPPMLQMPMNSQYQLIPIGPRVPLANLKMPPMQPMRCQNIQSGIRNSLIRTPPHVPILLNSNEFLKLTTADNKQITTNETVTVTSSLPSPVSTSDNVNNQSGPVVVNAKSCAPLNGQLLTLPPSVVKRLTLVKPLALKINNRQINVPPSGFFQTASGLKVFLPPNTFPTAEDNHIPEMDNRDHGENKTKLVDKSCDEQVNVKSKVGNIRMSKRYNKLCFIRTLFGAYDCMECIFKYLNIKDLISSGMVCKRWRTLTQYTSLWHHVSLTGMKVLDWRKAMQFLNKVQVKSINLIGLQHYDNPNRTWHQLVSSLQDVQCLQKITFGEVPGSVLHSLCTRWTHLESFCAELITDPIVDSGKTGPTKLDFGKFTSMSHLKELKLRGTHGLVPPSFSFSGGLSDLGSLFNLEILSVTSLTNVDEANFQFISHLQNIRELSLGDCTNWTQDTCERLSHLIGLEKLRLDGGGEEFQHHIGSAISNLKKLHNLELHNSPIHENLGSHLKSLTNLTKLVIYPQYSQNIQSDNKNALNAVGEIPWLKELEWILPDKKSMAIIDDSDDKEDDSHEEECKFIPFLVSAAISETDQIIAFHTDYLNMKDLANELSKKLPKTRVKITSCKVD